MRQFIIGSALLVVLWVVTVQPVLAEEGKQNSEAIDPQVVLEQIEKRLDAISNYQCTHILSTGRSRRIEYLARDRQGRARVRLFRDDLDATSIIWDGSRTITVRERVQPNGIVLHSVSIVPKKRYKIRYADGPNMYLDVWMTKTLSKALEDGTEIRITPTEQGYYRVAIGPEPDDGWVAVLDPQRGYLPVQWELFVRGERQRCYEIEFEQADLGIWFPCKVRIHHSLHGYDQTGIFTGVKINDPDLDRLLVPALPDGSTVADEVRGVRYVVDHKRGWNLTGEPASPANMGDVEPATVENVYVLDAGQALKRIAPVHPGARSRFIGDHHSESDSIAHNTIYVFQCNDQAEAKVSYKGAGFLKLSEVLSLVCGLDIYEYSGPEDLLELRFTGDWIVRENASILDRLEALKRIIYEQEGMNVTFQKRQFEVPVVRATGAFQYHPLPNVHSGSSICLSVECPVDEDGPYTGGGSGKLSQLLRHITNRIGTRFVDDTSSSDVDVSWSDFYLLRMQTNEPRYEARLSQLLDNVAQQTGLTFTKEQRTIDEWHLQIEPRTAANNL